MHAEAFAAEIAAAAHCKHAVAPVALTNVPGSHWVQLDFADVFENVPVGHVIPFSIGHPAGQWLPAAD